MNDILKPSLVAGAFLIAATVIGALMKRRGVIPEAAQSVAVSHPKIGPILDSAVAVGNNITQDFTVQHHYHGEGENEQTALAKRSPSSPSAYEILQTIKATKPFDRDKVRSNYLGVPVSWPVHFSSIRATEEGWRLHFESKESVGLHKVSIFTMVETDQYPSFKIIHEGHLCWITGKVSTVKLSYVDIANGCKLEID